MGIEHRYGGNPCKRHNMSIDEFLDVLFATSVGMDTVGKIARKTRRGQAVTAQLVMLLLREGFLSRHKVGSSSTLKVTQRAHVLMQRAIEVEKDLGLLEENRWGVEIHV